MKSEAVRAEFIAFFKSKAHTFVPGSPVAPQNDPTLLFTNAGMNQFKDVFLGQGSRDYTRAVNSQVCVRVSGKHNDLEDVGMDTTHLTSFEMLGNWSFGDYYKKESITWAWELFTSVFKLPKDKLYATVYRTDQESADLWKSETEINPAHVLFFGEKENFWEMGEIGPCGPCSELHLDRGPDACDKQGTDHTCEVNGVCARYIELWNLVFIQYNREKDGQLVDLPAKHVDTGAGLERLVAYLQGTFSNYNTDLFIPIIKKIESITGISYSEGIEGMPHRVLADHARTLVFAISDNVMPSNEGRGYVLRRLLRRGLRYASKLGIQRPIIHELVDPIVEVLGSHFTSLKQRADFIKTVIEAEEVQFLKTLHSGIKLFDDVANAVEKSGKSQISGADAFKLYDTFGFPIDLTQVMARERNLSVELTEFESHLDQQRNRSRSAQKLGKSESLQSSEPILTGELDEATIQLNTDLLAFFPPKTVAMGGEARIVTHPLDRVGMARHHTATHLLQAALRRTLGDHVHQAGSLVDVDRLRFDFSHFQALTPAQLQQIETEINAEITQSIPIETFEKPIDEAKAMGAMALFGEKYDDIVRVVKMGDISMELCVGTHVPNTSAIQAFKFVHESAIAAGVRRIEALAGHQAIAAYDEEKRQKWIEKLTAKLNQLKTLSPIPSKWNPDTWAQASEAQLEDSFNELVEAIKKAEKHQASMQQEHAKTLAETLLPNRKEWSKTSTQLVIAKIDELVDGNFLRSVAESLTVNDPKLSVILIGNGEKSGAALVKLSKQVSGYSAVEILKEITVITGGGGGGKPDMAQAGGLDFNKAEMAINALKKHLEIA